MEKKTPVSVDTKNGSRKWKSFREIIE
jgi:hypothetical protein